jgi:hypothetical protein
MIFRLLAGTNCVMGLIVLILELRCFLSMRGRERWIKSLYGLAGLYWSLVYAYVFIYDPLDMTGFGKIFIRPAFTLTLAVMAMGAIWRLRSMGGGCK